MKPSLSQAKSSLNCNETLQLVNNLVSAQTGPPVRQLPAGPVWSEEFPLQCQGERRLLPGEGGHQRLDVLHQLLHAHPQHVLLPQVAALAGLFYVSIYTT